MKYIKDKFNKPVNPYDYNTISLRKMKRGDEPSVRQQVMDRDIVLIGKTLGLEDKSDFSKYSDKLNDILHWAQFSTDSEDIGLMMDRIKERMQVCPNVNSKKIVDVWASIKLDELKRKEKEVDHNGKEIEKEEVLDL